MFSNPEKILIQFGLSQGAYVADFGSGAGYYALLISKMVGEKGKVFAVDVNKDMVKSLSRQAVELGLPQMESTWGDLEKENGSGLKDKSVDSVVVANSLFSISDKKSFIKEIKRVLKNNGRVLLVEWSDSFAGMGPHKDHIVAKEESQKLFEEEGFKLSHNIEAGEHHYGVVFRI